MEPTLSWGMSAKCVMRGLNEDEPHVPAFRTHSSSSGHHSKPIFEALAQDVSCDVMYVEHERPYKAIIDAANNQHCDLIVMASHGRHGISAIVLGSVTVKVLTHSTIPVLVYR
jgi:nucleotide-binding universal stress UspA family protein